MRLNAKLKNFFFDRRAVIDAIGQAEAKNLSRIGAFLRTRARSLLRRRKATAPAGSPPSVHTADQVLTLKNIQFAYESGQHAVIVGPIKFISRSNQNVETTVPNLMEFGGQTVIHEERYPGSPNWYRRDSRYASRNKKEYRSRVARYAPRPFMRPALEIEIKKGTIMDVWRASITG